MIKFNRELLTWKLEERVGKLKLSPTVALSVLQHSCDDNPSIYIIYRNGKYHGNCKLHWNFKCNKVSVEMASFFGGKQDLQAFLDVCLKIDRLIAKSVNDITG